MTAKWPQKECEKMLKREDIRIRDPYIVPLKETVVNIDYRHTGIGSNSCGPALSPEYRFTLKDFSCAVKITPEN